MSRRFIYIYVWTIALIMLALPALLCAAPAVVGGTTSPTSLTSTASRRTFYDEVNHRHWLAYYNGSAIEFRSTDSLESGNWQTAGTLNYNSSEFALVYKEVGGVSYVVVAVAANSHDIVLRRGIVSDSSIAFAAEVTALNGTADDDSYAAPSIAVDGSNHLWIAAVWDVSAEQMSDKVIAVVRSSDAFFGDLSQLDAPSRLGKADRNRSSVSLLQKNDGRLYLLSGQSSNNLEAWEFDGSNWLVRNAGGDLSWFGTEGSPIIGMVLALSSSGAGVYVGGSFGVYQWDGAVWTSLGISSGVNSIAVSGSDVYVGGSFTDAGGDAAADNIARWDGTSWHALGAGLSNTVRAIAISGSDVYVGGGFTDAGGVAAADSIARWDGGSWNALGSGLGSQWVYSIAISGADIYVGGWFINAGGIPAANNIARWDGGSWNAFGGGLNDKVYAIAISGSDIYVGGEFTDAGGIPAADRIVRWDGSSWNALGSGIGNWSVNAIAFAGADVYVGGWFSSVTGVAGTSRIARWDGSAWQSIGNGTDNLVNAVTVVGGRLYIGGAFKVAGGNVNAPYLAAWDGNSWSSVGGGDIYNVYSLAVFEGDVIIGGDFAGINGNAAARSIARWDGANWQAIGNGLFGIVSCISVSAGVIYAGVTNPGINAFIYRWDGTSWQVIASLSGGINSLAVSGSDIYVGGGFINAGGDAAADYIARWNGSSWQALGLGLTAPVYAVALSGSNVYVGGNFVNAGGDANADYIARWDGTSWNALGAGLNNEVRTIAVSGSDVIVGGLFTDAGGGAAADYITRWDGSSWNAIGGGLNNTVYSITVSAGDIYVGGDFTDAGGNAAADRITRWDGSTWQALDSGLNNTVKAIAVSDDTVFAGGNFLSSGDVSKPLGYFAWYSPTAAPDLSFNSKFSALVDEADDLHILYSNSSNNIVYRHYDESLGIWQSAVTLGAGGGMDSLDLSLSAEGILRAFGLAGNTIIHKTAVSPYVVSDWQVGTDTLYSSGTNSSLAVTHAEQWGRIPYFWVNGAAAPYNIMVDYFDLTQSISGNVDYHGAGLSGVLLDAGIHGNAVTDVAGSYSISGIPRGKSYTLTPTLTDYGFSPASVSATMTASSVHNFSAELSVSTVSGSIVQNGMPVAGATVTISSGNGSWTTVTSTNGGYSLAHVSTGVATIVAEKNGQKLLETSINVTPGITEPLLEVDDVILLSPLYSFWNGFLGMVNVLELMNTGDSPANVNVEMYDLDGTVVSTVTVNLPAGTQRDFILNDLDGFSTTSYGLLKVDGGNAALDGRVTSYRPSSDTWGDEFDFVYSLELSPETTGETMGMWNTYVPAGAVAGLGLPGKTSTLSPNWLSVANLDNSTRNFTMTYRDQTGESIITATLRIPPHGKRDIQAGHEFLASGAVGSITVTPEDNSTPYIATITRYGDNFAFATPTRSGTEAETMLPAGGEGLSVLELANASNATNHVELAWYDMNGVLLKAETAELAAYSQQHFIPTDVLPEGSYGSVVITPSDKIIAGAASYLYDNTGSIATAHYLEGREVFGKVLSGTFNTYLDMYNWLRVTNNSLSGQFAHVDFGSGDTESVYLPAHGRRDLLIPNAQVLSVDGSYGSFTISSSVSGILSGSVVRNRLIAGNVDYQATLPLR
ncbi:MAG: carboxypeptidase-like regulatory domain-containing protein [bacterium]|nr:carboxypeptidase-like regulatory domain-containing protein [bacterium]